VLLETANVNFDTIASFGEVFTQSSLRPIRKWCDNLNLVSGDHKRLSMQTLLPSLHAPAAGTTFLFQPHVGVMTAYFTAVITDDVMPSALHEANKPLLREIRRSVIAILSGA